MNVHHHKQHPHGALSRWLSGLFFALLLWGLSLQNAVSAPAPTLVLGTALGSAGQTVNIPVTFTNDAAVAALQFDVQYNSALLSAGTALPSSLTTATGHGVSSALIAANTVRVVVTPAENNGVLGAGQIVTIPWILSSSATGGSTPLTLTNVLFTDSSAIVVPGSFSHGSVRINYAPVASNKTVTTNEDQAVSNTLVATDSDNQPLLYTIVTAPARGSVAITNANSGAFTYTPNANVNGTDSFTFRASDGKVNSNVATVTITIAAINDAPVLSPIGNRSVNEGATSTITLSATDVDSSDLLNFSATGLPAFATLTNSGNRSASLTLAPNYSAAGSYPITVTITDNGTPLLSASETFTLTVVNVNAPPTANAGPDKNANGGTAVSLPGSGSDLDGTISSYAWSQVNGSAVTLSGATTATASFTAPAVTRTTTLTFQLTVTDNGGAKGSDQVVVTVVPTGKPDLSLSAIGSPLAAAAGTNIAIANTVINNGTADAEGNFDVGLYLIPQPVVHSSNFESGTLEGWTTLKTGAISVISDASDGKVLRKSTNGDPNGGQTPLASSVNDFEFTVQTRRLTSGSVKTNCYSLTDSSGNGYGLCLNYNDGKLYLNRRTTWGITNLGTAATLTGGTVNNQWYTLQLTKQGTQLIAKAYLGKVVPAAATPIATVSTTNTSYTTFTQVNVNGGYDYYSDNVKVVQLATAFPTNGSEIFLGKRVVYGLMKGASSADSTNVTIPAGVAAGTYAVAVKADIYSVITESSETNNLLFGNRQFVITVP